MTPYQDVRRFAGSCSPAFSRRSVYPQPPSVCTDYVQFIDKDPEVIARQKELERRGKADLDESDRQNKVINEMIAKDKEKRALRGEVVDEVAPTALVRDEHTAAVKISFSKSATAASADGSGSGASFKDILKAKAKEASSSGRGVVSKAGEVGTKRKKSALEMIKEQEEGRKRKKLESEQSAAAARKDYWLKEVGAVLTNACTLGSRPEPHPLAARGCRFSRRGILINVRVLVSGCHVCRCFYSPWCTSRGLSSR